MKALSIRQPWVWAILHAEKRIENRERKDGRMPPICSHRGPLLIHAAKGCAVAEWWNASAWMTVRGLAKQRPSKVGMPVVPDRRDLHRGGIVGVCNVVAHIDPEGCVWMLPEDVGGIPSRIEIDRRWHLPDSYGLVLDNVRPLPFVPFKGALGFFDVPDALVPAEARAA